MPINANENQSRHGRASGNGASDLDHEQICALAHQLWTMRGSPAGSPEQDWFEAEQRLEQQSDYEHLQAA